MDKRYAYEDFPVGREFEFGNLLVTREDILRFAGEFDPQPFHLDDAAAEASLFKGLSASGWHTCAMVMRMMCDGYILDSTSLGSPGIDHIKWKQPVRPGDTLKVHMTVTEARVMNSKPHIGLVRSLWKASNQHGETVLEMDGVVMFALRNPGTAQQHQQRVQQQQQQQQEPLQEPPREPPQQARPQPPQRQSQER